MKKIIMPLFIISCFLFPFSGNTATQAQINRSIASYKGSCPCPYSIDRAGRRCGKRSAYSRAGGAQPLCYPED